MKSKWRKRREDARVSQHRAAAAAETTITTWRLFEEGGPDAIKDPVKRASCLAVWSSFSASARNEVA
jgi:hypothetical protein